MKSHPSKRLTVTWFFLVRDDFLPLYVEDEESKRTHKYPLKIPVAEKLLGAPNLMVWGWLLGAETVPFEAVRLTLY
jgi:hypothetical protein